MKIAMVSVPATMHVAELSAALARHGHQVSLFTRRDDPDIAEKVETADGYTVFHASAGPPEPVAGGQLLAYMGPFARYLSAHWEVDRPDVTHGHTWMSGIATQLTARHLGLPAVQTFHGLGGVPRERSQLQAKVARAATWVTVTCTDEVFQLTRMGISRRRTSVIPCGVDTGLFTPDGPRAPKFAENRIVAMGTLLPPSSFDTLVRALPMTLKTELVIVVHPESVDLASDPEACRLRDLANELGVSRRLHLYGSVARADMPAFLRSADVVVCDPSYEPSGIGALEAMACGVSVVASTVGCMRDIVVDDVTGRLVSPKDPVRMADAINSLLRDSFRRKSFGASGRDRVRARYSWDRIVADTLRIYETLARPSDPRVTTPA